MSVKLKCKHNNLTLEFVLLYKPGYKFQKCFSCHKEIGKWKIPDDEWEKKFNKILDSI